MPDSFFRSGQAAKQLGVSSYHLRRLCETGAIAAELTAGQQWRISGSEIARLLREGVPDIPVESDDGDAFADLSSDPDDPPDGLLAAPSAELIEAAEDVKIAENRLKKRRVERESEEVEDWFRDRDRQQAEREASERQKAEAARAERRRQEWFHSWVQYALRSRPFDAPREIELEIHHAVRVALASLGPDQPRSTTQRLVDAAVEKVLRPWKRKKEIRAAIESALKRLPWDINHAQQWASVKQEALEAAGKAVGKLPADATVGEMQEAAWLAVQPIAWEYGHWKTCRDMAAAVFLPGGSFEDNQQAREAVGEALDQLPIGTSRKELEKTRETALQPFRAAIQRRDMAQSIYLTGGTVEEDRKAREAVSEALAQLPLGASPQELEKTKEATLAPFLAAIAKRKVDAQELEEQARRDRERELQLANVESRVDRRLSWHVAEYLRQLAQDEEIEFDGSDDRWQLEKDLKKRIRPMLLSDVREEPGMSDDEIDELIEDLVDDHIKEFLED